MIVSAVSVKTVTIEAAEAAVVSGAEDAQLTVTCRAAGGPPVPEISWRLPEALAFDTEEEVLHRVMDIDNQTILSSSAISIASIMSCSIYISSCVCLLFSRYIHSFKAHPVHAMITCHTVCQVVMSLETLLSF